MQALEVKKWQYGGIAGPLIQTAMPTSCHIFSPHLNIFSSRLDLMNSFTSTRFHNYLTQNLFGWNPANFMSLHNLPLYLFNSHFLYLNMTESTIKNNQSNIRISAKSIGLSLFSPISLVVF